MLAPGLPEVFGGIASVVALVTLVKRSRRPHDYTRPAPAAARSDRAISVRTGTNVVRGSH